MVSYVNTYTVFNSKQQRKFCCKAKYSNKNALTSRTAIDNRSFHFLD